MLKTAAGVRFVGYIQPLPFLPHVVKEVADGVLLKGTDDPNGMKHDGTHYFASYTEIRDIVEWIPEPNGQGHTSEP